MREYNSQMIENGTVTRLYVPGHCVCPGWQSNGSHELV